MSRKVIRQAIVVSLFVAIILIVLLVNASTTHRNIAGAHPAYTGVMLIAPAYQHQHKIEYEV
jgi:hypothetical protein